MVTTMKTLFSAADAVAYLEIYPTFWAMLVEEHNIPFEIVGTVKIFRREDVEAARIHVDAIKNRPRTSRRRAKSIA